MTKSNELVLEGRASIYYPELFDPEKRPHIYYQCLVNPREIPFLEMGGLRTQSLVINNAYVGRSIYASSLSGLNIEVSRKGGNGLSRVTITYKRPSDRRGLMRDLKAKRVEDLVGKEVRGYSRINSHQLVGLSAY